MGVPRFFRWLVERYPSINHSLRYAKDSVEVPEFDNLYIDTNGIIHQCYRLCLRDDQSLDEQQTACEVVWYIERLFNLVQPRKLLLIAVDGVAPRAKLNQQRKRRYLAARERRLRRQRAEAAPDHPEEEFDDNDNDADNNNNDDDNVTHRRRAARSPVPESDDAFDSNCITPGTDFMRRLSSCIDFFVRRKMTTDPRWRSIQVVYSSHQVPGEGEHKIMEYIRSRCHDPTLRHCLYGLDADLIFLGLATHQPFFSLLREDTFSGKTDRRGHCQNYQLLHLNLLREYLQCEFSQALVPWPAQLAFDLERVIDDFVFMCLFVGNDFLPRLPFVDVREGSLNDMLAVYKRLLPNATSYLTNDGEVNVAMCKLFLDELAALERQSLDTNDATWEEAFSVIDGDAAAAHDELDTEGLNRHGALDPALDRLLRERPQFDDLATQHEAVTNDAASDSADTSVALEIGLYYAHKFQTDPDEASSALLRKQVARQYATGLSWVMHYYYRCCPSWEWCYPFHYAPLASDLVLEIGTMAQVQFGESRPLPALTQLMAVLPPDSAKLLPDPHRALMCDCNSPLAPFYPDCLEVPIDMEGCKFEWEGVLLLPFLDMSKLVRELDARTARADCDVDVVSQSTLYCHDSLLRAYALESPLQRIAGVSDCRVARQPIELRGPRVLRCSKPHALQPLPSGFPSLTSLPSCASLEMAGIKLFGLRSRWESLVLRILPSCPEAWLPEGQDQRDHFEDEDQDEGGEGEGGQGLSSGGRGHQPQEDAEDEDEAGHGAVGAVAELDVEQDRLLQALAPRILGSTAYVAFPHLQPCRIVAVSSRRLCIRTSRTLQYSREQSEAWAKTAGTLFGKLWYTHGLGVAAQHHLRTTSVAAPEQDARRALPTQVAEGIMVHYNRLHSMEQTARAGRKRRYGTVEELAPLPFVASHVPNPDRRWEERPPAAPGLVAAHPWLVSLAIVVLLAALMILTSPAASIH